MQNVLFFTITIFTFLQKVFIKKKLFSASIHCIGDILDINRCFLTLDQINTKYNISANYLHYIQIKCAINEYFKKLLITPRDITLHQKPHLPPHLQIILKDSQGSKHIYQYLIRNKDEPTCIKTWTKKINIDLDKNEWKLIFSLPFLATKDTYIQWFQFRINHRILGTNYFSYKIKYIDCANCTFCSTDQETIEHLFWNCPKVQQLVTNYLKHDNVIYMDLDISKMLFGCTKNSKSAKNILLILFKLYIYKCRTSKNTPTVTGVGNFISYKYKILKKVAIETRKLEEFERDWHDFGSFLKEQ